MRSPPVHTFTHACSPSPQIYLTDFRLRLANIASQPQGNHARYSASIHRLLIAAQIAIDAYEEDVLALVKRQLFAEIAQAVKDRNHPDHVRAIERKKNWDVWRKSNHCLSYGSDRSTLEQVVRFSSVTVADIGRGLQKSSRGEWSLDQFAEDVIRQAQLPTARSFRAPIDPAGTFGPVLCACIQQARLMLRGSNERDVLKDFKCALVAVMDTRHINFIPDTQPNAHGTGAPLRTPSIHAWTTLGATSATLSIAVHRLPTQEARAEAALAEFTRIVIDVDPRASWDTVSLKISEFPKYLDRTVLPQSWSWAAAQPTGTILESYQWADERMRTNLQDPLCSLALSLAFLISKVLPTVAWDSARYPDGVDRVSFSNPHGAVAYFRTVPWIERNTTKKSKGVTQENQYFTLAAIVFLNWMDPNSPLRKDIDNGGTPSTWNNKHGTPASILSTPSLLLHCTLTRFALVYRSQVPAQRQPHPSGHRLRPAQSHVQVASLQQGLSRVRRPRLARLEPRGPHNPPQQARRSPQTGHQDLRLRGHRDAGWTRSLWGAPAAHRSRRVLAAPPGGPLLQP